MELNKIDEFWNSANSLFKVISSLLTSRNFVTMVTWRNYFSLFNYIEKFNLEMIKRDWRGTPLRGCLHDTGATFALERVHSGSLSWLYICLHDTTTKFHAGASHPGVSSPLFLYQGENFTSVRNLATVSCKRETTTRFGVKSVCRQTGTGSACAMFPILNPTCILLTWSVPSNNGIWNGPASCKRDTKSKSHPGMKLAPVRVFSCKHPLTCLLSTYISTVTSTLGRIVLKTKYRKFT